MPAAKWSKETSEKNQHYYLLRLQLGNVESVPFDRGERKFGGFFSNGNKS